MGEPPSLRGFVQVIVIESSVVSIARGTPGALGGSNGCLALIGSEVIAGSDTPY